MHVAMKGAGRNVLHRGIAVAMHCVGDIAHMGKNALLIQWLGRLWCSFLNVLFFF